MSRVEREEAKPVATPRPVRGTELQTVGIHNKLQDEKEGDVYYEGYVDGKRYVVPDKNLEAMKDMINLSMRRRKSSRFKHQTSYEYGAYDRFNTSLKGLLEKFESVPLSEETTDESESDTDEEPSDGMKDDGTQQDADDTKERTSSLDSEKTESRKSNVTEKSPSLKSEKQRPSVRKSEESKRTSADSKMRPSLTSGKSKLSTKDGSSITEDGRKTSLSLKDEAGTPLLPLNDNGSGAGQEKDEEDPGEYRVRFLISGHFHAGETPMFIIQEYQAESGIFDDQNVDIKRIQSVGDVDVNIVGKFYNESIIEERNTKPKYLNIKPQKIKIDRKKSKIYYDYFEENIKIQNFVDILINGQFVTNRLTKEITPMLSFRIKKRNARDNMKTNSNVKETQINSVRFCEIPAKNRNPFVINGRENIVNMARIHDTCFVGMDNKRGLTDVNIVHQLKTSKKSPFHSNSPEVVMNKRNSTYLTAYMPVIPRSLQNSLLGYKLDTEDRSYNKESSLYSSKVARPSKRQVMNNDDMDTGRKQETPKKEDVKSRISTEEYVCRIKDYQPTKKKFFNLL
uniref:Uncharacterized protein n=1 Tax=Graphocephala atropunctata TaxID=36148 RepID=A0A1B6M4M2_9HEMI